MRNSAILRLFVILYIEKDKKRDGMSGLKEWKEKFPTPHALAFSPVPSLPSLDGSIARIIFSPSPSQSETSTMENILFIFHSCNM